VLKRERSARRLPSDPYNPFAVAVDPPPGFGLPSPRRRRGGPARLADDDDDEELLF
jgi:hypothetical protein